MVEEVLGRDLPSKKNIRRCPHLTRPFAWKEIDKEAMVAICVLFAEQWV